MEQIRVSAMNAGQKSTTTDKGHNDEDESTQEDHVSCQQVPRVCICVLFIAHTCVLLYTFLNFANFGKLDLKNLALPCFRCY